MTEEFISITEAAEIYGCSYFNMYSHTKRGNLEKFDMDGKWVVKKADVLNLSNKIIPRGHKRRAKEQKSVKMSGVSKPAEPVIVPENFLEKKRDSLTLQHERINAQLEVVRELLKSFAFKPSEPVIMTEQALEILELKNELKRLEREVKKKESAVDAQAEVILKLERELRQKKEIIPVSIKKTKSFRRIGKNKRTLLEVLQSDPGRWWSTGDAVNRAVELGLIDLNRVTKRKARDGFRSAAKSLGDLVAGERVYEGSNLSQWYYKLKEN